MENSKPHPQLSHIGHPSGFELFGAAYTVKLAASAPLFSHLTANYLVEVVHRSAEINFSVSSLCFMTSGDVNY